ncbi:ABC transporter substrate-binding protein [Metabacillus indicus]|uniref:ABC transporter substrate-binding protein n=1 Tax=Metabacillus indicus TaxID=246786 RepID=UPI000689C165|nr:sugar ABC transporter substrate-binding protein [Metabacillus indicus]
MKKGLFKKLTAVSAAAALSIGLIGCSSEAGTEKTEDGKVELKVGTWAGAAELQEFQEVVDKVNKESDSYKLSIQSIPADYYKKIQTMASAKQAPDLFWLSQEYIPMYADLGVIAPIDEAAKDVDFDDYYEGALNIGKFDDKLFGLPWINQPVMLYYNKKMFEENGVALPDGSWTWEDFDKAASALTKDTNGDGKADQFGTVIDGWPNVANWIWSYGGEIITADGEVKIDSPESIEGIKMMDQLINESKVTPNKTQAQNTGGPEMFKTGKVAMFFGGAGDDLEKQVGDQFEIGMTQMPVGTEEVTSSWIAHTVMSSATKDKEAAADALIDLTNAVHDWKILPPVKSKIDKVAEIRPEKEYALEEMKKGSEISRGFNNQPKQNEIDNAIWLQLYEPILLNKKDPEQAAKDAAEEIRKIVGQ